MWTDRHRTRLKNMVMQAGLDELARFLEWADPPARSNAKSARRVMGAVAWHLRTGGGRWALPDGILSWRTVSGWFRRWGDNGVFTGLMRSLTRR